MRKVIGLVVAGALVITIILLGWSLKSPAVATYADNVDEVWASETGYVAPSNNSPAKSKTETPRQKAVDRAQIYVDMGQFSKKNLISQLSSGYVENYAPADGEYAANHIDVDYFQEAFQSAEGYMELETRWTRSTLIDQLMIAEGFTKAEALYAVDKVGL